MFGQIRLDPTTFLFFMAVFGLLSSLLCWSFSRTLPHNIRGLKEWSLAMLFMGLSFIAFLIRDMAPIFITHFLANGLALGIPIFLILGITNYRGLLSWRPYVLGIYLVILVIFYFEYMQSGATVLPRRTLLISIPICVLLGLTAYHFYKAEKKISFGVTLSGVSLLILTLAMANRIYTVAFGDPSLAKIDTSSSAHFIFFTVSALTAISGTIGFILMCIDRLNQEVLEQTARAQRHNRYTALGEMAAGVAHEVNNPLAIIQNNLYRLREKINKDYSDSEEIHAILIKTEQAIGRVAKIVRGLLEFSKEGEDAHFLFCSLDSVIEKTLDLCKARSESKNIDLKISLESNINLYCNPAQISQVLLNLINNAMDAIEEAKKIKDREFTIIITAKRMNGKIHIVVANNGLAISPEVEEKLFQPFFTTKPVGHGIGLSLGVSKSLAEQNGGQLSFVRGSDLTSFLLELPQR